MGRGNDPTLLGIGERETVGLHPHWPVAFGGHGIVVRGREGDRVRRKWLSRFGELSRHDERPRLGHHLAEEVKLPIRHAELSPRPDVQAQ